MANTPWIGIGTVRVGVDDPGEKTVPDMSSEGVACDVVEVRLPLTDPDWAALDQTVPSITSAGHRILLLLPPVRPNPTRQDIDAAVNMVGKFCERYSSTASFEGVVLEPVEPVMDSVGPYLDGLSGVDAIPRVYVSIDTGVPMDQYPALLGLLRTVSELGAVPYIIRPSDTGYGDSFLHTRYFTAAARLRKSPFVLAATAEPPSRGSAVSAVFETVASGASGLVVSDAYFVDADVRRSLADAATHLQKGDPTPNVAVLWPSITDLAERPAADLFHRLAISLRDVTDYDILDERRVCEIGLDGYQVVVLVAGCCFDRDALDTLYEWVKKGGAFVANCVGTVYCPDDATTCNRDLLDRELAAPNPAACCTMRRIFKGASFHYSHEIACKQNADISPEDGFIMMVARVLRRNVLLGTEKIEPDALLDGVHAARLRDRILFFNTTDQTVAQEVLLPSAFGTRTVDLPPLEIKELLLDDLLTDKR